MRPLDLDKWIEKIRNDTNLSYEQRQARSKHIAKQQKNMRYWGKKQKKWSSKNQKWQNKKSVPEYTGLIGTTEPTIENESRAENILPWE